MGKEKKHPLSSAVSAEDVPARTSSAYPEPFRSRVLPRSKRALGNFFGLQKIGINQTTLEPGSQSALRHAHSHEEEFVYLLEGELVLITDDGEQSISAGMCIGFPANTGNAHHLINRGKEPATYLEVSNRDPKDTAEYPDDDFAFHKDEEGNYVFTNKQGEEL